jgi:hypothetical protein
MDMLVSTSPNKFKTDSFMRDVVALINSIETEFNTTKYTNDNRIRFIVSGRYSEEILKEVIQQYMKLGWFDVTCEPVSHAPNYLSFTFWFEDEQKK